MHKQIHSHTHLHPLKRTLHKQTHTPYRSKCYLMTKLAKPRASITHTYHSTIHVTRSMYKQQTRSTYVHTHTHPKQGQPPEPYRGCIYRTYRTRTIYCAGNPPKASKTMQGNGPNFNISGLQADSISDGDPRRRRLFSRANKQEVSLPRQGQVSVDPPKFTMIAINVVAQTTPCMDQDCIHMQKKLINALV